MSDKAGRVIRFIMHTGLTMGDTSQVVDALLGWMQPADRKAIMEPFCPACGERKPGCFHHVTVEVREINVP